MRLHWHRGDLRATDNRALAAAASEATVLPVFVFDPDVLEHASPPRVAFLCDALDWLRGWYRKHDSDLLTVQGDPTEELPRLVEEYDADSVFWNHDYSGLAQERDEAVRTALDEVNIEYENFHDAVHHEPGAITTNNDDPYSVFSYFGDKWLSREKESPHSPPDADVLVDVETDGLPDIEGLGFREPDVNLPTAGTEAARERLESFCAEEIYRYDERDRLADEPTSRLSQDLKYGTIGVREVYAKTEDAMKEADEDEQESIGAFRRQLAWREFYTQVLYFNPNVVTENYKDYGNGIDWRTDEDELDAWRDGRTGYPVVDAGMRQLAEEAYMHNRARLIVGSFLTKDLAQDWRRGYEHFRALLVDHNTANDNGNWQWVGSTGTDAQPYFRVFNPMKQGADYDPDAEYIKRHVPELRDADPEDVHSWHELSSEQREEVAPEYPAPIVDHNERREEAIEMFNRARGNNE